MKKFAVFLALLAVSCFLEGFTAPQLNACGQWATVAEGLGVALAAVAFAVWSAGKEE